jgi:hypothetical protein
MEEALIKSSQSKKERVTEFGPSMMNSTQSQIYSNGLPNIHEHRKSRENASIDFYRSRELKHKPKHKKTKSEGRNAGQFNTAVNFRANKAPLNK